MINKVLIVEDHESANISVQRTLEEMQIGAVDHAYYCDEALEKIIQAKQQNRSYDLLITDLYFEPDNRPQQITNGTALIEAARQVQPDLKVLVFSAESNPLVINPLYEAKEIDGYVRKARNDARDLKQAIQTISQNQRYYPKWLLQEKNQQKLYDWQQYDITIVDLLSKGVRIKEMPQHLTQMGIQPSGLSSIEKRLNLIRDRLDIATNEQLIAYCKDNHII